MLIAFDDMIEDMEETNKKTNPKNWIADLFMKCIKLNVSLVFTSQSEFKVPKDIGLNLTHFIMKIPRKRKLEQIPQNHSFNIDFKDFMKL